MSRVQERAGRKSRGRKLIQQATRSTVRRAKRGIYSGRIKAK